MKKRVFEERGYRVFGRVVPLLDFKLFVDMPQGFRINQELVEPIIKMGEQRLEEEIPQLLATEYMLFKRNGNRSVFEDRYFARRTMAFDLALAEFLEGKGRFLDKLIDTVWLILEESSWVPPACNPNKNDDRACLPYDFADNVDFIDLFSAVTGAQLAVIYHLCHKAFNGVTSLINERILYELDRRIIKPFLDDRALFARMWWSGVRGNHVNNWCPWIVSNVLTVCALTVEDQTKRTALVQKSLPMLDAFIETYHEDGGCEEGATYWQAAGGALYNACVALYDLTNGYIDIYDEPLLKNMGEYVLKMQVTDKRMLSFSDASNASMPYPLLVYHWGRACGSSMMVDYALDRMNGTLPKNWGKGQYNWQPYRLLRFLSTETLPAATYQPPTKFYLNGIILAATRETSALGKGLYLAIKGGNNGESHNHNDLGTFVVYTDETPLFLDVGVGAYTRRTFNHERYSIWSMCSDHHNCATLNGVTQAYGKQYATTGEIYDEASGKLTLDLTNAYPAEAGLTAYHRSAVLENGKIVIEDRVALQASGEIKLHYMVTKAPEEVGADYFVLFGRRISFAPSLSYSIEAVDCTAPEVESIPRNWGTDAIYRITLTGTVTAPTTFTMTVS